MVAVGHLRRLFGFEPQVTLMKMLLAKVNLVISGHEAEQNSTEAAYRANRAQGSVGGLVAMTQAVETMVGVQGLEPRTPSL
jgi:hypothetical protein